MRSDAIKMRDSSEFQCAQSIAEVTTLKREENGLGQGVSGKHLTGMCEAQSYPSVL